MRETDKNICLARGHALSPIRIPNKTSAPSSPSCHSRPNAGFFSLKFGAPGHSKWCPAAAAATAASGSASQAGLGFRV